MWIPTKKSTKIECSQIYHYIIACISAMIILSTTFWNQIQRTKNYIDFLLAWNVRNFPVWRTSISGFYIITHRVLYNSIRKYFFARFSCSTWCMVIAILFICITFYTKLNNILDISLHLFGSVNHYFSSRYIYDVFHLLQLSIIQLFAANHSCIITIYCHIPCKVTTPINSDWNKR